MLTTTATPVNSAPLHQFATLADPLRRLLLLQQRQQQHLPQRRTRWFDLHCPGWKRLQEVEGELLDHWDSTKWYLLNHRSWVEVFGIAFLAGLHDTHDAWESN